MPLDPNNFLSYSVWLSLSRETRQKIAKLFGFSETVTRETMDSTVISDGYAHASLAVITKERMQEITDETSDNFYDLFNALVEVVEGKREEITHNVQQEKQEEVESPSGKVRGRPKKGGE